VARRGDIKKCFTSGNSCRYGHIDLVGPATFESEHKAPIPCLDLENITKRFVIACSCDGVVGIYDTHTSREAVSLDALSLVAKLTKESPGQHSQAVYSVCWYPVDTGIFVTGSRDKTVKVWDANSLEAVISFDVDGCVLGTAMSPIASSHCLIAVTGSMDHISLCDVSSGGSTHKLMGHRGEVWSCAWSHTSEWELISGGHDGQVCLWDVRRPGALDYFDMYNTEIQFDKFGNHGAKGDSMPASHRIAHGGQVVSCYADPSGLYWITSGNDGQIKLWNTKTKTHVIKHFGKKVGRTKLPRGISTAADGKALFHPSGNSIHVFDLYSGSVLTSLTSGHYGQVHCCVWNEMNEELYSAGADKSLLVWAPKFEDGGNGHLDGDEWSDDNYY